MSKHLADLLKRYGVTARGVVHVGANVGHEIPEWAEAGVRRGLFVEPLDEPFAQLRRNAEASPGFTAVQALCAARDGETVEFHPSSNAGESSSMLRPKEHLRLHGSVAFAEALRLESVRLDTLMARLAPGAGALAGYNVLVVDVQGAEMEVLKGAGAVLARVDAVWCELSQVELYEGNSRFLDVLGFLDAFGLRLAHWRMNRAFSGDGLFIRVQAGAKRLPKGE